MKALKYIIVPVVVFSGLIGNVYAGTPAYIRSSAFSALGDGVESFFRTIYYLFMFALILAAAYYITKFLARKGIAQNKSKTMKLMESMPLGADRSLHLIQVGTQYFLIGCASKGMILISELDQDKLFEEQPNSAINLNDFDYESFDEGFKGKDFGTQINSVKNNLKKLKSMVRGNNDDESK
ncbi:MAG TPA: flagellar biosynthetic protein FliO [Patescibacteria group bacterium]|nr:flagellar biosynthetic protein FliO [Patescibacteria group bacterium]